MPKARDLNVEAGHTAHTWKRHETSNGIGPKSYAGRYIVRGSVSVSTNEFGGARQSELDGHKEAWNQRPEIGKPVRLRLKHNDGN